MANTTSIVKITITVLRHSLAKMGKMDKIVKMTK